MTSVPSPWLVSRLAPAQGHVNLSVHRVANASAITSAYASSPLKLLTPRSRGPSVWAYLSNYGGGLVTGDRTTLEVSLAAGTTAFLGTQSSTKIYRSVHGAVCTQTAIARVAEGAVLAWVPDSVQAFAGSRYHQRQTFHLESGAGLVLVDSVTSGRAERGEHWDFEEYRSRNDVFIDGTRAVVDAMELSSGRIPLEASGRMGRYRFLGLVLIVGTPLAAVASTLWEQLRNAPLDPRAKVLQSASRVRGGTLLRLAGAEPESVRAEMIRTLQFLPAILGDDPFARRN